MASIFVFKHIDWASSSFFKLSSAWIQVEGTEIIWDSFYLFFCCCLKSKIHFAASWLWWSLFFLVPLLWQQTCDPINPLYKFSVPFIFSNGSSCHKKGVMSLPYFFSRSYFIFIYSCSKYSKFVWEKLRTIRKNIIST